jgi:hypothetical protein
MRRKEKGMRGMGIKVDEEASEATGWIARNEVEAGAEDEAFEDHTMLAYTFPCPLLGQETFMGINDHIASPGTIVTMVVARFVDQRHQCSHRVRS